MAGSTQVTSEVQKLGFLVCTLMALIVGLLMHSFIIGVNVNDWWKGRSVTPVDHIVTALGFSRMCSQCALTLISFLHMLSLENLYSYITAAILDAVYVLCTYANVWLTALLSIVFCLKIANLHIRLFLYLRRVIVQRVVFFIVASVLLAAFNCFILLSITLSKMIKDGTYNGTIDRHLMDCPQGHYLYYFAVGSSIPLLFYYISSVLLFTSLYYHTTRMKRSGNLTINLETYYSVMKFVSFTFIYMTGFFTGHFVFDWYLAFYCMDLQWLYLLWNVLPALHSSYLIYRTVKLRNQMSKVLQNLSCYSFQKENTETSEHIEKVDE